MKKSILIAAFLLTASFMNNSFAAKPVTFGISLDANLTDVRLSDRQSSAGFHPGAALGGFIGLQLGESFSLQPGIAVNYTETKIRNPQGRERYKYAGINIPVILYYGIDAGNGRIMLGAGPHIGYGFSADRETEKLPEDSPLSNVIELDHWYAGGGVTAGYEFPVGISINAGYKMGFDFRSRHKSANLTTRTISLGLAYRF